MNQNTTTTKKNKLKVKDLLLIGLLALCGMLFNTAGGLLAITPYTYLASFPLIGLFSGIIFVLLLAKVPKKGVALIYALVFAVVFFMSGYTWLSALLAIAGIIDEVILGKLGYKNKTAVAAAYITQHTAFAFGSYIPYLFYGQQYIEKYSEIYGEEYMELSASLITPTSTVLLMIANIVLAYIGVIVARKLLKKHFEKAGMI